MNEISILFPGGSWAPSYSLSTVIREHVYQLLAEKIPFRILTFKGTPRPEWLPESADYRAVLSAADEGSEMAQQSLLQGLEDTPVIITHDFVVLEGLKNYVAAFRENLSSHPNRRWYHVLHFDPAGDYTGGELLNCHFICLSPSLRERAAGRFKVNLDRVLLLENYRSPKLLLGLTDEVTSFLDLDRAAQADFCSLHPFSLIRSPLKQPFQLLFTAAAIKAKGRRVYLIFADPVHEPEHYRNIRLSMKWLANAVGLSAEEIVFTSEITHRQPGLSSSEMSQLFRICNVFVHASEKEGGPLAIGEAMANGNLCVVNSETAAFHDMLGEHAIFHRFENPYGTGKKFRIPELLTYFKERRAEYDSLAEKILQELAKNPVLAAKRRCLQRFGSRGNLSQFLRQISQASV